MVGLSRVQRQVARDGTIRLNDDREPMTDTELTIVHDDDANRFIAHVPGGGDALLTYAHPRPMVIDVTSTYVPTKVRRRGIASELMRAVAMYARAQGYRLVPSCSYASEWFERHPEERDLLAK